MKLILVILLMKRRKGLMQELHSQPRRSILCIDTWAPCTYQPRIYSSSGAKEGIISRQVSIPDARSSLEAWEGSGSSRSCSLTRHQTRAVLSTGRDAAKLPQIRNGASTHPNTHLTLSHISLVTDYSPMHPV